MLFLLEDHVCIMAISRFGMPLRLAQPLVIFALVL